LDLIYQSHKSKKTEINDKWVRVLVNYLTPKERKVTYCNCELFKILFGHSKSKQ